jgi:hypothetical protein
VRWTNPLAARGMPTGLPLEDLETRLASARQSKRLASDLAELRAAERALSAERDRVETSIAVLESRRETLPILIDPTGLSRHLEPWFVECDARGITAYRASDGYAHFVPRDELGPSDDYGRYLRRLRAIPGALLVLLVRADGLATTTDLAARLAHEAGGPGRATAAPGKGRARLGLTAARRGAEAPMTTPRRRALPDNLDPLVDTLSNVVGILVIVIALTQLELGDALARVAAGSLVPPATEGLPATPEPARPDASEGASAAIRVRLDALRLRSGVDLVRAAEVLTRALEDLRTADPALAAASGSTGPGDVEAVRDRAALEARGRPGPGIARARACPPNPIARPRRSPSSACPVGSWRDCRIPRSSRGRESWILVRHGRVYLVDREALFDTGRQAIERIVPDGANRALRPDEFESVAHYLRKTGIGLGPHRWRLATEPGVRLVLEWHTRDGGIERSQIADSAEFGRWLARRKPDLDTIRFHVWNDSFETYLEARARIEAAGFRGGWRGHEADQELEIGLRFGLPDPEVRPLEVD